MLWQGTLEIDLTTEPIGHSSDGTPVMLSDLWPSDEEISEALTVITPDMFRQRYADAMNEPRWDSIPSESSPLYPWASESTYIRLPTFFSGLSAEPHPISSIQNARVLLKLGDSITTDHISPAGAFPSQTVRLESGWLSVALLRGTSTPSAVDAETMR